MEECRNSMESQDSQIFTGIDLNVQKNSYSFRIEG